MKGGFLIGLRNILSAQLLSPLPFPLPSPPIVTNNKLSLSPPLSNTDRLVVHLSSTRVSCSLSRPIYPHLTRLSSPFSAFTRIFSLLCLYMCVCPSQPLRLYSNLSTCPHLSTLYHWPLRCVSVCISSPLSTPHHTSTTSPTPLPIPSQLSSLSLSVMQC